MHPSFPFSTEVVVGPAGTTPQSAHLSVPKLNEWQVTRSTKPVMAVSFTKKTLQAGVFHKRFALLI